MAKPKQSRIVRDLTRDDIAALLDVHVESVGRYDRDGAPHERRGNRNFYNEDEYRAWMASKGLTGKEGRPNEDDSPDLEKARLRKENALAAKYELQVKREKGELVPTEEVRRWIGEHVTTAKNKLIGLGAAVAPLLEGRDAAERQTIIDGRVSEILEELAAA